MSSAPGGTPSVTVVVPSGKVSVAVPPLVAVIGAEMLSAGWYPSTAGFGCSAYPKSC